MKNQIVKVVIAILFTLLIAGLVIVYSNNESMVNKEKLMDLLEIKEAETFKPIYIKHSSKWQTEDGQYYEIKFEISVQDYEKNELDYNETYYEGLLDCKYKERKDENIYICIRRISDFYSKELYENIKE